MSVTEGVLMGFGLGGRGLYNLEEGVIQYNILQIGGVGHIIPTEWIDGRESSSRLGFQLSAPTFYTLVRKHFTKPTWASKHFAKHT